MAEEAPKLLDVNQRSEHHESKDKLSGIFKKSTSLIPSPSRIRKSMSASKEDCNHLTDSVTSITDKTGGEREERKHSFLQLFSRKPPSSLENLPAKSSSRQHRDSSSGTTPSSSLSFLQKLSSFHTSHSPSTPQISTFTHMEEGRTVPLFPLKEMEALESIEENAPQPTRHPTQPEEIWSEPTTSRHTESKVHKIDETESRENWSPVEIRIQPPPQSPTTDRLSPFRRRSAMDEAAHEREQVQRSLEACLEKFRAGQMRSLTDSQVNKLQNMHTSQLCLTEFHKKVMQIDDPLRDGPEINSRYTEIANQLTELHTQMDNFSSSAAF